MARVAQAIIPVITQQPGDLFVNNQQDIIIGNPFEFTVVVDGAATGVSYVWRKNTQNIVGGTNASYGKEVSVASDVGSYTVLCYNTNGSTLSSNAILNISFYPVITNQPRSNAVAAGSNVHLFVRMDYTKPPTNFTFQWNIDSFPVIDGNGIAGSETTDLWLTNVAGEDTGDSVCEVMSDLGFSYTTNATLNVVTPPSVFDDPEPQTVLVDDSVTMTVILNDSTTKNETFPLTYQWRKNGVAISGENGVAISGETVFTYDSLAFAATTDAGDYTCYFKNWAGSVTSAVAHLTVYTPLTITHQPTNALLAFGASASTLTVTATGTAPISYQWRSNLVNIPNATNFNYPFVASSTNQSATYDCELSNIVGTVDTDDAIIIVRSETVAPITSFITPLPLESRWTNTLLTVFIQPTDTGSGVASVRSQNQTTGGTWVDAAYNSNGGRWTNTLTLVPGTNILYAESYDVAGNVSPPNSGNTRSVFYPVPVPFTLLISGNGVVNTDTNWPAPIQKSATSNFMTLEYGRSYNMTSSPTSTFKFVNWTGSVSSASTNFTFLVQSNMTITAVFGETNRPTIAITNPAASGRFTNFGTFDFRGTATDNVQVASVKWQLNTNAWNTATGASSWLATVAPLVGSNIFRAYAIDTSSNLSTTNTLIFTNVTVGILTVLTNGRGTVTNSLHGQTLFVSSNYTMSATAYTNLGFVFTNWTGTTTSTFTVQTNGAILNFTMKSNLTLQANFKDVQNPTLTVSNTLPAGAVTNLAFTVLGSAADNDRVTAVNYQLNNTAWAVATGTNSWTASLTLVSGSNTFKAYSVDAWGNKSTTNILTAVNPLLTPVMITLTFTNNTARAAFSTVIGATYYLEAKGLPETNIAWTTVSGSASGNGNQITITDTTPPATNRFYRIRATAP